jgi:2-amino-4-hydroxy-6-hydroxymethyldihydropteridine diphosphokinase
LSGLPQVLLGFGGNLGDPIAAIEAALDRLEGSGVRIQARSSFYRTPPWGDVAQPDFVNSCALAETRLEPRALLALTQAIQRELGRMPGPRWGPRPIDIDTLDYEGVRVDDPDLVIPHPGLTERPFVLVPLVEIAPDWIVAGRPIRDWAAAVDSTGVVRIEPGDPTPPA